MFVRTKASRGHEYLQVVESRWEDGKSKQQVIASLGRVDKLVANGDIEGILKSLSRFSDKVRVVEENAAGRLQGGEIQKIGPSLVFERLWKETGLQAVVKGLLSDRRFGFSVERAVFMSVLHRLFSQGSQQGSDRQAQRWQEEYRIERTEDIALHHLYRTMRWLGETRCEIENRLFERRRDLFSAAGMYFFDTTSIYFEGSGGESLGQYGKSKDHRSDRLQMIVGAVVDQQGQPICAPMWPGNTADVTRLVPLVEEMKDRFGLSRMNIVADRGMISNATIESLEKKDPPVGYILGAKMRGCKEVKEEVLSRAGCYRQVRDNLRVKEVDVEERRYIVCYNPEEAERDRIVREQLLEALEEKLNKGGAKDFVKNKGYRRYLKVESGSFSINRTKAQEEQRYDGKFVLRTNLELPAEEIALQYKELWRIERWFRDLKGLLDTRPIYHHWDATICGHVFVSFLALVLLHELDERRQKREIKAEWSDMRRHLEALQEIEIQDGDKTYWLRSAVKSGAIAALRSAGVAIPSTIREG